MGVATVAEASDKAFCSGLDRVGPANPDTDISDYDFVSAIFW